MKRAVLQVVLLAVMSVSAGGLAEELKASRPPSVCSFADGVYRFEFPGDRQLSLTFPLNLKQGEYYRIEFEVRCGRGIEAKKYAPSEGHLDLRQTAWYVLPQTGIMGGRHGT